MQLGPHGALAFAKLHAFGIIRKMNGSLCLKCDVSFNHMGRIGEIMMNNDKHIANKTAIKDGLLIDGTGAPAIKDGLLLIEDGIIQYAGEAKEIPSDYKVIDASGKTLLMDQQPYTRSMISWTRQA